MKYIGISLISILVLLTGCINGGIDYSQPGYKEHLDYQKQKFEKRLQEVKQEDIPYKELCERNNGRFESIVKTPNWGEVFTFGTDISQLDISANRNCTIKISNDEIIIKRFGEYEGKIVLINAG